MVRIISKCMLKLVIKLRFLIINGLKKREKEDRARVLPPGKHQTSLRSTHH